MSSLSARKELKVEEIDEPLGFGDELSESDTSKMYEIIVAGGENKKSVEHILLPATLPEEKNLLARGLNTMWSAMFRRKSSANTQCKTGDANSVQKWSYLRPMKTRREAFMTVVYKDQMFAFGGFGTGRSMEVLDLNNERARWQYFRDIFPEDLWGSAAVVYGDNAYIFGGTWTSANIYKLSLVAPHTVEVIGHMPEGRVFHNAEIFDDKVVIICGSSTGSSNTLLNSVIQYDITNNRFQTLPALPVKVSYAATASWKDNVIIVGGKDEQGHELNTVSMYNISSGEHQKLRPMKHRREACAAVVAGDMLVVMGGQHYGEHDNVLAECFNFQTNRWRELPPMKQIRRYPSAVAR